MAFADCHIITCCDCKGANSNPIGLDLSVYGAEHPILSSTCVITHVSGLTPDNTYIAPAFATNTLLDAPTLRLTYISPAATIAVSSPKVSPSPEPTPVKLLSVPTEETIQ